MKVTLIKGSKTEENIRKVYNYLAKIIIAKDAKK